MWHRACGPRVKKPFTPEGVKDFKNPGDTYFRTCSTIIGSESLTTVFGMVTGVTFQICSPEKSTGGGKANLCQFWSIV